MVKLDKSACLSILRCLMSNHLIFMGEDIKTQGAIINWDTTEY